MLLVTFVQGCSPTPHTQAYELLCPTPLCRRGRAGKGFDRKYRLCLHLVNAKANIKGSTGHGVTEHEADRLADEAVTAAEARLQEAVEDQAGAAATEGDVSTDLSGMEPLEMLFDFENL